MSVVKLHELAEYMNREFDATQSVAAQRILDSVEGELEVWLRRPLERDTYTSTQRLPASFDGKIRLPYTPVTSIVSVTMDGVALTADASFVARRWGIEGLSYGYGDGSVVVVYEAGIGAASVTAIVGKILAVAARDVQKVVLDGAPGVGTLSVEGLATTYTPEGWSEAEKMSLIGFKRRSAS